MLKAEDKAIQKSKEFNRTKNDMIKNYMVSNKLIHEMSREEKAGLITQLRKAKSVRIKN